MFVVCKEHIEDAIDEFLVDYEESPDIFTLEYIKQIDFKIPETCHFCEKKPRFLVIQGEKIDEHNNYISGED